jgi:hypothetical protein
MGPQAAQPTQAVFREFARPDGIYQVMLSGYNYMIIWEAQVLPVANSEKQAQLIGIALTLKQQTKRALEPFRGAIVTTVAQSKTLPMPVSGGVLPRTLTISPGGGI